MISVYKVTSIYTKMKDLIAKKTKPECDKAKLCTMNGLFM